MSKKAIQRSLQVQVGTPWPKEIEVHSAEPTLESPVKATILKGFAGLVALLLLTCTLYGCISSEEMLKDVFSFTKYLAAVVILWAVGPTVHGKLLNLAKIVTKLDPENK